VRALVPGRAAQRYCLTRRLGARAHDQVFAGRQRPAGLRHQHPLFFGIEQRRFTGGTGNQQPVESRRAQVRDVLGVALASHVPLPLERRGDRSVQTCEASGSHSVVSPSTGLITAPPVTSAALATRERRRSVRTCSSKSAGLDEAAAATSYVTTLSATRSMRCWSKVCIPYCSRESRI